MITPTKCHVSRADRVRYDKLYLIHSTFERRPEDIARVMATKPTPKGVI